MYSPRLLSRTTEIIRSQRMHGTRMFYSRREREAIENETWEFILKEDALWVPIMYQPCRKQLILDIAALSPPLSHARRTFNLIHNTDTYANWNNLILYYAQKDKYHASDYLDIHHQLQSCANSVKPDIYAHQNLPKALENLVVVRDVEKGHCIAIKCGVDSLDLIENALVCFYGACGEADSAFKVLKLMPERNLVAWNSALFGHVMDRKYERTLTLYMAMLLGGIRPDEFSLVSALAACAQTKKGGFVWRAHGYMFKMGLDKNLHAANALLYYYAKCGPIGIANQIFAQLEEKNVVSWNSMIVGMSVNRYDNRALELFEEFEREKLVPNEITLAGVLYACIDHRLMRKGLECFERMTKEYGAEPIIENYACMVILLAKSGMEYKVFEFIQKMPLKPNKMFWTIVSSSCIETFSRIPMKECERNEILKLIASTW